MEGDPFFLVFILMQSRETFKVRVGLEKGVKG